jgi:pimeloyl-ACP methyl ester carboxylesterase
MLIATTQAMPPVAFADLGDIRMAYYDTGGADDRTPVLFSHGYPDIAFGWRHQLADFVARGRRAIAPDQRGYGLTSVPADVASYGIDQLCGDLVALLDRLDIAKAVICGHDWGGMLAWHMALAHPDRVAGVIGVCTPFSPRPATDLATIFRALMGDDMYIVHFQTPDEPEAIMDADPRRAMEFYMRRPPAGATVSQGFTASRGEDGSSPYALLREIARYDPSADPRDRLLSNDEMGIYVDAFARTGFGGGINWYRNLRRNWEQSGHLPDRIDGIPCLMITAEFDPWLPPSAADGMEQHIANLTRVDIAGAGHWVQAEQPARVNAAINHWLNEMNL